METLLYLIDTTLFLMGSPLGLLLLSFHLLLLSYLISFNIISSSPPLRVNVGCGPAEERVLLTGLHAVADIYCENCKTTLGWKYVSDLYMTSE